MSLHCTICVNRTLYMKYWDWYVVIIVATSKTNKTVTHLLKIGMLLRAAQ